MQGRCRSGTSLQALVTGRSAAALHGPAPVAPDEDWLVVLVWRTLVVVAQPALADPVLDTAVRVRVVPVSQALTV